MKQQVFAELRGVVAPECVLATNTSSLSVTEMGADVGMHFFNPVALMPLVELIRTAGHDRRGPRDGVRDRAQPRQDAGSRPGRAGVRRQPAADADDRCRHRRARTRQLRRGGRRSHHAPRPADGAVGAPPDGRPARGEPRAAHAARRVSRPLPALAHTRQLRRRQGRDRRRRARPTSVEEITEAALEALADECRHLLEEGVVASAADIDTCMLLGAGFPFFLGGITKHLDQTGVSERVVGTPLAELGGARVHA